MAETSFTLPGGQKIPKKTALIVGGLVIGAFLLLKNKQGGQPAEEEQFGEVAGSEDEGASGGFGTGDSSLNDILAALQGLTSLGPLYTPAPAPVYTLQGGGDWSASELWSDPSQELIEGGYESVYPGKGPYQYESDEFAGLGAYELAKAEKQLIRYESAKAEKQLIRNQPVVSPSTFSRISGRAGIGIQYSNPVVSPSTFSRISGRAGVGDTRQPVKETTAVSGSKAKAIKARIRTTPVPRSTSNIRRV